MLHIAIGCDHKGLNTKQFIISLIELVGEKGHTYQDFGCYTAESVDYPDIAQRVAEAVAEGDFEQGILVCDTGIGMSIAANKVKGIRAALCHDAFSARCARQHNNANTLCLRAEQKRDVIREIIEAFLAADFEGGRHSRRVDKITAMEE